MDTGALKDGLAALGAALGLAKQVKDLLPAGPKRDEVERALEQAERQLKLAEAQFAQAQGRPTCTYCWPPEVMRSRDGTHWTCPVCGLETKTGSGLAIAQHGLYGSRRRKG